MHSGSSLFKVGPLAITVFSAALFGGITTASKSLLEQVGPATLGALTFLGAGLVALLTFMLRPSTLYVINKKEKKRFIVALLLGAVLSPLLLMTGLQKISASYGAVLANVEGIATACIAWLFFKEPVETRSLLGILLILSGVLIFSGTALWLESGMWGALVVLAYLLWAIDLNLMHGVQSIPPNAAIAMRGLAGAVVMAMVAWLNGETLPDAQLIVSAMVVGAIGFGWSFLLLLRALPALGSARSGAIFACAPVFGFMYGWLFDGIEMRAMALSAIVMIMLGLFLSGVKRPLSFAPLN